MEAYENMVNLVRSFHSSAENPDPAYVFYKLTADDAFHHVASADEVCKLFQFHAWLFIFLRDKRWFG